MFRDERPDADLLLTSGKYGESLIEYKIAVPGHVGASDDHLRWMFNLTDPCY